MTSSQDARANQDLLGYTLLERIGEGGYGEVWIAEAPGGLRKAIKLIYGYHDESRAQRELKSLNYIKELRHPFLLSLERIEIVDGRLVIVTELADNSLCDRFDACLKEGLIGIPRSELLSYMREAADALDYIAKSHNLQHLDIKPENILLVSGHVKVADFGLVKDIQNCTQSVMGGLTPAFAAPELFDGRPSATSDQYSLAIVYQEMLTGQRPFSGSTPAQLAAQHIHGRPNLRPLPRVDQTVVARALAKDPTHRFGSCIELVNELTQEDARFTRPIGTSRRTARSVERDEGEQTMVLSNLPTTRSSEGIAKLPPIAFNVEAASVHPTLFLGIGGLGTQVIREVRERLRADFGSLEALPAFRFMAIDVDADDLFAAMRGGTANALSEHETVHIPLRRPEQYRALDATKLQWLSRRWIYNIPRSRKTEGIRPLGRLALVDNCHAVQEALMACAKELLDQEALRTTAERIGLPGEASARVYVVGGVSGGTASGTLLDVAYTVRTILAESGCPQANLTGLLLHTMGTTQSQRRINASNSYACLREMVHYRRRGFPGDETMGIPGFEAVPPFDSTYFVHYGDDCSDDAIQEASRRVAEYVYLDASTACSVAHKTCRDASTEGTDFVRTMGLTNVDISMSNSAEKISAAILQKLVKTWTSGENKGFDATTAVAKLLAIVQLTPTSVMDRAVKQVTELAGLHPFDFGGTVVEQICRQAPLTPENVVASLARTRSTVNDWFHGLDEQIRQRSLAERTRRMLSKSAAEAASKVKELVYAAMDLPGTRLSRALVMICTFQHSVGEIRRALETPHEQARQRLDEIETKLNTPAAVSSTVLYEQLQRFAGLKVQDELTALAMHYLNALDQEFVELQNKVESASRMLTQLASTQSTTRVVDDVDDEDLGFLFENSMIGDVLSNAARLVTSVDQLLQDGLVSRVGSFWKVVDVDDSRCLHTLEHAIRGVIEQVVRDALAECDIDELVRSVRLDEMDLVAWIRPWFERSTPYILDCGGQVRLFMSVPCLSSGTLCANALEEIFNEAPTVVPATRGGIQIYHEVQAIPVANVALRIIEDVPEAAPCVGRLESRNDVEWEPLTGIA